MIQIAVLQIKFINQKYFHSYISGFQSKEHWNNLLISVKCWYIMCSTWSTQSVYELVCFVCLEEELATFRINAEG